MLISDHRQLADQAWALADAGRLQEADALFGRLCELTPEDAEPWMMRGAIQAELGDRGLAVHCLRQALELDPDYADAYLHLGKLALAAPNVDEAQRCAERAIALDPDYTEAWILLALIQGRRQCHLEAEQAARKALSLDSGNIQAVMLLGQAVGLQGRLDEAAGLYRQVLAQHPNLIEARLKLASVYYQTGQFQQSEAAYRAILQETPQNGEAWRCLGDLLMTARRPEDAVPVYQQLMQTQPDYPGVCNNLGNAYLALGDMINAEVCYRKALALPDAPTETFANLGLILQSKGELIEAVACYEKALTGKPDSATFHQQMALGLQSLGRYEEAIAHCDLALRFDPGSENALAGKADILQKQGQYRQSRDLLRPLVQSGRANANTILVFTEAEARVGEIDLAIGMLEAMLERDSASRNERQQAHASLGNLYDKCGSYDQAFANFKQSNSLKQGRFNPLKHEAYVSRLIATYTPELLAARAGGIGSTDFPVFIVGMPRSGTSLVEQILASHPAVFGAGELDIIQKFTHVLSTRYQPVNYPECMNLAGFDVLEGLAGDYLAQLRNLNPVASRITDKMPHNFLHLGLIQILFPGARVIHVGRAPLDTCLSCYFQEFSTSHSYAYDLTLLGEYYRQYERLMAHWRKVLGLPMLEVRYEDLVDDQEGISRRMIEFCGLEWDDRVLRFHETQRNVATPSFDQVRQPMYRKSLQRWKNYESHLGPLIAVLGKLEQ